jgi:hypothetical protein
MSKLHLDKLKPIIAKRIDSFLKNIFENYREHIHSIYVVGSSLTNDFQEKHSDINSIFVLEQINLKFLELLAPMGKKFRKQQIAAPLIMTPEYIKSSCDVFPIEFLNYKFIHQTIYGEDLFTDIQIKNSDLRQQCEHDIKADLIGLRQGYLSTMGNNKKLRTRLVRSLPKLMPLFRGIIFLYNQEPKTDFIDVIEQLEATTKIDCSVFYRLLENRIQPDARMSSQNVFEEYYHALEKLSQVVDEITV